MTSPRDDTTTDTSAIIAALRTERDAALAREAALAKELAARDAALTRRNSEFDERIEQQSATIDVLKVMSASPGDPQPVFDLIARRAAELCNSRGAAIFDYDGELDDFRSRYDTTETEIAQSRSFFAAFPMKPERGVLACRAILDRQVIHTRDTQAEPELLPIVRDLGIRSILAIPLLRDDNAVGAFVINSEEPGGFTESQVALLQTFAEQAVIAISSAETYRALQERTAALATRNSEYGERIEQQAATIDVLKVMSHSPGDPQPVFDLIVERARDLCEGYGATVLEFDGRLLLHRASTGIDDNPAIRDVLIAAYPKAPERSWPIDLAVLERRLIIVNDLEAEPNLDPALRNLTHKSVVALPLMRGEVAIGALALGGRERGGFSDSQIELLKTFAEQAVIAITSAETYRALQTRTGDLQQSLEYQTATSDVLKVISRSTFDLQPVLATLLKTAARLCDAETAGMTSREGDTYRVVATFSNTPAFDTFIQRQSFTASRASVTGRAVLEGRIVQVADLAADPEYAVTEAVTLGGVRTLLGVPLLREGEVAGVIILGRFRVQPFTDRQIELVRTFADQAVIAIENTRLITEQREALEQQTATAEVLQVINASPGDLAPVFDAMLDRAMRLCDGAQGTLWTFDGERMCASATAGYSSELAEQLSEWREIHPFQRRLSQGERVFQIVDLAAEELYHSGNPLTRAAVDVAGIRTVVFVALVKDATTLGGFTIGRREVRAFTDKHIALLQNFAEQAVIAMENARLITEQQEALEQQTATADVLQVINASPGNLTPVFEAILNKAHSLCGADLGALMTFDGEYFRAAAIHGFPEQHVEIVSRPFHPNSDHQKLIGGERLVHILDVKMIEIEPDDEVKHSTAEQTDVRTLLAVPLRKDGTLLGFISACRLEVRAFAEREIALLENFAAQAVIAMENARLIAEQREALEQQTATAEVLQVINASPGNLAPVFNAMLEKAMRLCEASFGSLWTLGGHRFGPVAHHGLPPPYAEYLSGEVPPAGPGTGRARLLAGERYTQILDLADDDPYRNGEPHRLALVDLGGARTALLVSLRRDDAVVGFIMIYRQEVRPFTAKQIALLENFAAQAVIAMENARLITEQREALEQQTATAEVLQVINASPGDLTPVFDAILDKAHTLCGAVLGSLVLFDGTYFRAVATHGWPNSIAAVFREPTGPNRARQRLVDGERFVQVPDIRAIRHGPNSAWRDALVESTDARTMLLVPLRKDGALMGFISAFRPEVRVFSDKEIALPENFAAQAVIAMENARLLTEQQEALEQQTATAEVLQVINASPGDLTPVFDAILEKAHHLCDVAVGSLSIYLNGFVHTAATRGFSEEYQALLRPPYPAIGSHQALMRGGPSRQTPDFRAHPVSPEMASSRYHLDRMNLRTGLWVPLRKDGTALGCISAYRDKVQPFSEKEIALLENFAAQAVIAMENARLLDEIRQRQEELRVTFDNMGDGVAMFDTDLRLTAWNRNFQRIIDLPDTLLETRPGYADYLRLLAERGEFGTTDIEAELSLRIEDTDKELRLERVRPDGRVIEVRRNAVSGGGFVLIYSDITERKRSEEQIGSVTPRAGRLVARREIS